MFQTLTRQLANRFGRIGADARDSDDVRLRKSLLVLATVMFIAAGLAWGLMYFALGKRAAGWIPFGYGLVSLASLLYFAAITIPTAFIYFCFIFIILQ